MCVGRFDVVSIEIIEFRWDPFYLWRISVVPCSRHLVSLSAVGVSVRRPRFSIRRMKRAIYVAVICIRALPPDSIGRCNVDNMEDWRRLHNEEINVLHCSPNVVRVIKWRRMRWAGHVARVGEERGCIGSRWGNRREGDHWGDLGVDGWIILGWITRS